MCWQEGTFTTARHCCGIFVILAPDTKLETHLLTYLDDVIIWHSDHDAWWLWCHSGMKSCDWLVIFSVQIVVHHVVRCKSVALVTKCSFFWKWRRCVRCWAAKSERMCMFILCICWSTCEQCWWTCCPLLCVVVWMGPLTCTCFIMLSSMSDNMLLLRMTYRYLSRQKASLMFGHCRIYCNRVTCVCVCVCVNNLPRVIKWREMASSQTHSFLITAVWW